jgi:cold shock CspA family protein
MKLHENCINKADCLASLCIPIAELREQIVREARQFAGGPVFKLAACQMADCGGNDVFVHVSAAERAGIQLNQGIRLGFHEETDRKAGKPRVGNLRLL